MRSHHRHEPTDLTDEGKHMPRRPTATGVGRRGFIALGAAATTGAAVGAAGVSMRINGAGPTAAVAEPGPPEAVAFEGVHQSGVASPPQVHLVLTAYDLRSGVGRAELASVLRSWTGILRDLTAGASPGHHLEIGREAGASALTATVGVGGSLLDRLGVARPGALVDLPPFEGQRLDPDRSDGDLVVQLCADDPIVLAEADRALQRASRTVLGVRWRDRGFRSTTARQGGHTTRNLMGQLDGTNNVSTSSTAVGGPVWIDASGPAWLTGGTVMVFQRIRMLLDRWEEAPLDVQERAVGRHKASGAPIGSTRETDAVDLTAVDAHGAPLIPRHSHVRLSKPRDGEEMLRRGYSYSAEELDDGSVDEGLLFISYQHDPRTSFIPVQRRLAAHDALNDFTLTVGSGVFAILPGVGSPPDWLGRALLAETSGSSAVRPSPDPSQAVVPRAGGSSAG